MIVYSLLSYLTVVEGITWRQDDHTTVKMIKAVKGEDFKGYFSVKVGGKSQQFTQQTAPRFLPTLFHALGQKMTQTIDGEFSIVPIPNSTAVVGNAEEFRTLAHARQVVARITSRANVVPALRWIQEKSPAHRGGHRDPQLHFSNLRVVERPDHQIVLFDDVLTTGSQMVAAYRRLARDATAPVAGFVAGRTVHEQKARMLAWSEEDVPTGNRAINLDDLF